LADPADDAEHHVHEQPAERRGDEGVGDGHFPLLRESNGEVLTVVPLDASIRAARLNVFKA
jgi:hypothetical protein